MLRSSVSRVQRTATTTCYNWAQTTARTVASVCSGTTSATGSSRRLLLQRTYTTKSSASPSLDAFRNQDTSFKSTASLNQSRYQQPGGIPDLPQIKNRTPLYIALGILGVGFWAGSLAIAANHQKQGTSVVKGTLFNVRYDETAKEVLGDGIDYRNPKWPWIYGTVAHLKGKVDIQYDVRGSKGEGRVHFQAYRPEKRWITTVFTLTTPDGVTIPLGQNTSLPDVGEMM
ncbi:hypothetical protein BGW42_002700 [Actinomortierella wolfii]|nr:hypothetical protein BGW42_002700 [Actinomortierella wolfii]